MNNVPFDISDANILAARPPKNKVDADQPYAFFVEPEYSTNGTVVDTATLFLTNRECPFRCLMCGLWKNTTDFTVAPGAISRQIDFALSRLPVAKQIKLYNSGNFFDGRAIPRDEHDEIARRVEKFTTVVVENHPRLCSRLCLEFRDRLTAQLEIALGLETVHPDILPALNKRMTVEDFDRAVRFLVSESISVRAFVLLRPPFLDDSAGITWAVRSVEHAFSRGVGCCVIIPTRADNGIMERLQTHGQFAPPSLGALERTLETCLALRQGRVFVDLWDVERLSACPQCRPARIERLRQMNLRQELLPTVTCVCGA